LNIYSTLPGGDGDPAAVDDEVTTVGRGNAGLYKMPRGQSEQNGVKVTATF
jgi:hypothetical protein